MGPSSTNLAEVTSATDAGWRPDPTGRYEWRYWEGGWTNRVASSRSNPSDAPPPPSVPDPAPPALAAAPAVALATSPRPTLAAPAPVPEVATSGGPATKPGPLPVRVWRAFTGFFTSFADEPESYHSDRAVDIAPDPRGEHMLAGSPANFGRAGIVALAACGVAVGSYLPWLSGTIDGIPFQRTGIQEGHGASFTIGAIALVCAALLAVRLRPLRWAAMGIALVLAGLTFRELVQFHDVVVTMNGPSSNSVDLGTGMWIMAGCAVVALVASVRLGERE